MVLLNENRMFKNDKLKKIWYIIIVLLLDKGCFLYIFIKIVLSVFLYI